MKISIVIVTYNSINLIKDCIDSIYRYNDLQKDQIEIIVVDNSSEDEGRKLKSFLDTNYPQEIRFFKNENLGYGHGNNIGIRAASGEVIAIMNPDVVLIEPVFVKVIKKFKKNKKLAMIGGKQYGHVNTSFYIRPEKEFFIITLFLGLLFNRVNYYNENFMFLSGALLFLDKEKFESIEMFDENIFLYCEEPDVTLRFLEKGYKTAFDKNITYRHLIDGRNDMSDFTFKTALKSTQYYFKKFNFNHKRFIKQKIFSFKIKALIHKLLHQNQKYETARLFYNRYMSEKNK
ncbi:glycosyltransferase [Kaistella haifensis]|nr:glycosyltransferase [Kaistella haifensis]